jgi:lipase chaperone LimK
VKYLLLSILISLPSLLFADTYKWVNEEGVVTYSQTPPIGIKAERIHVRSSTPASGESSQHQLDRLRQKMADSEEDRELGKSQQEEQKQARAMKDKNCGSARSNLQKLEGLGNRLYLTGGEYKRLSEEERQSLMAQAKEQIKTNCGK